MTLQNGTEALSDEHQGGGVEPIVVDRLVPSPVGQVWARILSQDGFEDLIGKGARLADKGDSWRAEDGTHGVTRSFHPEEQVRVSWHAGQDAPATMLDLQTRPEGEGTRVTLRHEGLTPEHDRAALQAKWEDALHRLTQD